MYRPITIRAWSRAGRRGNGAHGGVISPTDGAACQGVRLVKLHALHPPAPAACRQRPSAAAFLLRRYRTIRQPSEGFLLRCLHRVKLCKPAIVDLGDRIGDLLPVVCAGAETLLDLDAVPASGGEAVDDVLGAITAIPLVWGSDAHSHARAGKRTIDGRPDFLF